MDKNIEFNSRLAQPIDVVIVGGGLVGCALACAIAQANPNIRILVCEAQAQLSHYQGPEYDPRVVALSAASVEFLTSIGVWPLIESQRVCAYKDMEVWDGDGTGRIHFSAASVHLDELGFIVENSVALRALRNRLLDFNQVHWCCPAELTAWRHNENGTSDIRLSSGAEYHTSLLVAADGAQSELRQQAGIETREWDYRHTALITTIRCEKPHNNIARQVFSANGPLAFLPLPGQSGEQNSPMCSIVWSQHVDVAERLVELNDQDFCAALSRASEHCLGQVVWADKRYSVPLQQLHAKDYGRAGFALLGDAAHRIHPLAGQGANLGFYDAVVLAAEVVRAVERHVPLEHGSIVKRYQRQRKIHNLGAVAAMEGFKRLFGTTQPAVVVARNAGLRWVNHLESVKNLFVEAAAGRFSR